MINDGSHIISIIARTTCGKHNAASFEPCYAIPADTSEKMFFGICNKRAVKAGANGKISQSSYQTRKQQPTRPRKKVS